MSSYETHLSSFCNGQSYLVTCEDMSSYETHLSSFLQRIGAGGEVCLHNLIHPKDKMSTANANANVTVQFFPHVTTNATNGEKRFQQMNYIVQLSSNEDYDEFMKHCEAKESVPNPEEWFPGPGSLLHIVKAATSELMLEQQKQLFPDEPGFTMKMTIEGLAMLFSSQIRLEMMHDCVVFVM